MKRQLGILFTILCLTSAIISCATVGKEFDTTHVNDIQKGEHKDPEYRKLSPLGQVPTFVDGDIVITDSTAALVYLAIKHGDERWLPRDAEGAALV